MRKSPPDQRPRHARRCAAKIAPRLLHAGRALSRQDGRAPRGTLRRRIGRWTPASALDHRWDAAGRPCSTGRRCTTSRPGRRPCRRGLLLGQSAPAPRGGPARRAGPAPRRCAVLGPASAAVRLIARRRRGRSCRTCGHAARLADEHPARAAMSPGIQHRLADRAVDRRELGVPRGNARARPCDGPHAAVRPPTAWVSSLAMLCATS